ncbi:MAG: histidine phosphatase family protein, partial [Planktomarina temperata]|nr:histidine phosphatase family protein [Planktomarina temperata]
VSDAKRTGQSFAALALSCPADALAELYLAEPASLRAAINAQRNTDCLLLLAHNPGIAELASALVQTPPAHAAFYTYPPGATLVLNCDPQGGAAQLMDFTTPADLAP